MAIGLCLARSELHQLKLPICFVVRNSISLSIDSDSWFADDWREHIRACRSACFAAKRLGHSSCRLPAGSFSLMEDKVMERKFVNGKVVVVTGAGGGIGRDIALAMAHDGAKVIVNDIGASLSGEGLSANPAQQVVDEIKASGGQAIANTDSVAEAVGASRIVEAAVDNFGRIDCVVNNAGILRDAFFHKM